MFAEVGLANYTTAPSTLNTKGQPMRPREQHRVTLATESAVCRAIKKLEMALGLNYKRNRVENFPDIRRAYAVIDELAKLIDDKELETPLEVIGVNNRVIGVNNRVIGELYKVGIESVEELIDITEKDFKAKSGVGEYVFEETRKALLANGFNFRRA